MEAPRDAVFDSGFNNEFHQTRVSPTLMRPRHIGKESDDLIEPWSGLPLGNAYAAECGSVEDNRSGTEPARFQSLDFLHFDQIAVVNNMESSCV